KIFLNIHRTDQRSCHDPFMLKRQPEEDGDPLIRPSLVLACHIEKNMIPAISPVIGQAGGYPLRAFCQQIEDHISSLAHHRPRFIPPHIRLFQKEVRGHADTDHLTASDLIPSLSVPGQRITESVLRPVDPAPVLIPHPVQEIHITVFTALRALSAAVPGVPDVVHWLFRSFRTAKIYHVRREGSAAKRHLLLKPWVALFAQSLYTFFLIVREFPSPALQRLPSWFQKMESPHRAYSAWQSNLPAAHSNGKTEEAALR